MRKQKQRVWVRPAVPVPIFETLLVALGDIVVDKNMESKKQKMKRLRSDFNAVCLKRDGNKCVMCGRKDIKLAVHHITDRHEMPNDGYASSNGITLCDEVRDHPIHLFSCHMRAETFHITGGKEHTEGFHPDDLYRKIGSTYEKAFKDSESLK